MALPSSITFFYPSKIIGGAEYLFIRMAGYIATHTNVPVYVVDYKDGFLRRQLEGTDVQILDYTSHRHLSINYDTVLVTPFNHLPDVAGIKVNAGVRVFFWSIHPTHFTSYFNNREWFITGSEKKKIAAYFKEIIEGGSMVFMDYPNYLTNEQFLGLNLKEIPYLPIACASYEGETKKYEAHERIAICWLGRIAVDKVASIINIAQHISRLPGEIKKKVEFVIIGTGEEESRLWGVLDSLDISYKKMGTMIDDELNNFLVKHVDIGFAMGTSTLEFAKLKIPVVLVDVFEGEIPADNKFQWLSSTRGFSLGEYYTGLEERTHTLADVLSVCADEKHYEQISRQCYEYYAANHEIGAISDKLLSYVSGPLMDIRSDAITSINSIMYPWFFQVLKKAKSYFQ